MKLNLFYLLPLLLIFCEACSTKSDSIPIPAPLGTYKGSFRLFVKKTSGSGYDTLKKDTSLRLKLATPNNFAVTGDTTTIHAGSKGLFLYDNSIIAFSDSTYKVGPQTKIHLAGNYLYRYTGTQLQIQRANALQDTVIQYDFTKTSN